MMTVASSVVASQPAFAAAPSATFTMEFGSARSNRGDAVIAAAEATLNQMAEIWPEKSDAQRRRMLGLTPMIGRTFNGKIFTQAPARQLVDWANTNHIQLLGFWSVGRDNGGLLWRRGLRDMQQHFAVDQRVHQHLQGVPRLKPA